MILVYFRWPQPVDSATNRTVPICPQSRVSVLFCSLSSPALDRSAPNRGSPGGGGESPQASSIYPPPPGRRVKPSPDFCRLLLCRSAPPAPCHRRSGPPISLEEWRLSISKIRGPSFFGPRARREATFFLVFFLDAHFRPFWEPFSAFGSHFGDLDLSETYVFLR